MTRRTGEGRLRIAVLGAGAMGSFLGARLFEGGADVTLLDINRAHLAAIQRRGLHVVSDGGARDLAIPAMSPAEATGPFDLVIVFTKTMHTRDALAAAAAILGPDTYLLSLQNGLDNRRVLEAFRTASHILIGITTYPADMIGPGHVESHGAGIVRYGACDGGRPEVVDALADGFRRAGIEAVWDPSVETAIWEKVAFNAALNGLCTICKCPVGDIGAHPETRALALAIGDEVAAVASRCGVPARVARIREAIAHALDHHRTHKPSMLQDLLAGRPTEVDAINGAVCRRAAEAGITAPLNGMVLGLVRFLEDRARR